MKKLMLLVLMIVMAIGLSINLYAERMNYAVLNTNTGKVLHIEYSMNPGEDQFVDVFNSTKDNKTFKTSNEIENSLTSGVLLHKIKGDLKKQGLGVKYRILKDSDGYVQEEMLIIDVPAKFFKNPSGENKLFHTFKTSNGQYWAFTNESDASNQEGDDWGFLILLNFQNDTVKMIGNKLNK